jgi:hypothetical protein
MFVGLLRSPIAGKPAPTPLKLLRKTSRGTKTRRTRYTAHPCARTLGREA